MFDTVLVANRGEIAVRVFRTLRRLGIRSVAVYSDADESARHVGEADVSFRIGPPAALESYLNSRAVLEAAHRAGAQAIHPGYGFLSENAAFARACGEEGIVFVGPPPEAIEAMGDKIRAKQIARSAGVRVVPGRSDPQMTDADLVEAALEVGYPLLVKPSAGGGGKGMRLVADAASLRDALAGARREAHGAFGNDALFIERYISRPRHIEIQVLADRQGTVLHLGERECSIQRRHQKIIEESPSPVLSDEHRESMGDDALRVTRACGYTGAGTVEFIISADDPDSHYFLEMNTRLQVEHPVTELVTGVDLVEWQLAVATGASLSQLSPTRHGHAIEARLYAEDPSRGFLPTGGRVLSYEEPRGDGVRVDSGIWRGSVVTSMYDPMLAKVIAWGDGREQARRRLHEALENMVVAGVHTNAGFLLHLLDDPEVVAGDLDTELAERAVEGFKEGPGEAVVVAATLGLVCELEQQSGKRPWEMLTGWRFQGRAWTIWTLEFERGERFDVTWRHSGDDVEVRVDEGEISVTSAVLTAETLSVTFGGRTETTRYVADGVGRLIVRRGTSFGFHLASLHETGARPGTASGDRSVRSPMPGVIAAVHVAPGEAVVEGDVLVVVEAMKMEHSVVSRVSGVVATVLVSPGDRVGMGQELAILEAPSNERPGQVVPSRSQTEEDR